MTADAGALTEEELKAEVAAAEARKKREEAEFRAAERKIRKFRRYGIGYLHIDLLYAPKIDKQRRYVYAAIDRVAKIAFVMIGSRKNKETGARFLKNVIAFFPYRIKKLRDLIALG